MDTWDVVARFKTERQALAMMDHPNIAKVFDAGATEQGQPYFVMEYIRGVRITEYCDKHRLQTAERLDLFMRVCQAVHHAHQKGVIHRDIKPSNVLVTVQDGKAIPKVIDFGVAKAIDHRLTGKTLFAEEGQLVGTPDYMSPEQAEMGGVDIDTQTDVYSLGVLLYELLVGALPFDRLYLRRRGYAEMQRIIREEDPPKPSTKLSSLATGEESEPEAQTLASEPSVADGSESACPTSRSAPLIARKRRADLKTLFRQLRGDLDWITMKALEKDRMRRYASATDFAADIQRHLDHEPVVAGPPSAAYRVKKFIRRNRGMVAASVLVFLVLVAGVIGTTSQAVIATRQRDRAIRAERAQSRERQRAEVARDGESRLRELADQRYEEIMRLADLKRLADARSAADGLWPAQPEKLEEMETWLRTQAGPLRDNLPKHEATLLSLRGQALDYDCEQQRRDRETHPQAAELRQKQRQLPDLRKQLDEAVAAQDEDAEAQAERIKEMEKAIAEMERSIVELQDAVSEHCTWKFADDETQWKHDTLAGLVRDLSVFVDPDPTKGTLASVERRLEFASQIEEQSITGPEAAAAWADAIASIAKLDVYGGLQLTPQVGLLPLRRDLSSGLWEFWHIQTGAKPEENTDPEAVNPWLLTEDTGLIFVLIPGGTSWMGAQKDDAVEHNYDRHALANEGPVHEVTLEPFFISKYEMTQGQWQRFTGTNPSTFGLNWSSSGEASAEAPNHQIQPWNPVEEVTWTECQQVLWRLGLQLPTEAQWEFAARAGTSTVWWTGDEEQSVGIEGAGNLADRWTKSELPGATLRGKDRLEDGWVLHAPVGSFSPNGFGLHDVIGNVWEWCRDWFGTYDSDVRPGDGLRMVTGSRTRVSRGGSFSLAAAFARSACRSANLPKFRYYHLGVRPARGITE